MAGAFKRTAWRAVELTERGQRVAVSVVVADLRARMRIKNLPCEVLDGYALFSVSGPVHMDALELLKSSPYVASILGGVVSGAEVAGMRLEEQRKAPPVKIKAGQRVVIDSPGHGYDRVPAVVVELVNLRSGEHAVVRLDLQSVLHSTTLPRTALRPDVCADGLERVCLVNGKVRRLG